MFKIKKLNKIAAIGTDILDADKFTCADDIDAPDGILVRSADMHEYPLNPELKAIARAGAGTNNIPLDKCAEQGIVVFNTPGANANAVKELVITSLLLSSRNIIGGIEWAKTLKGEADVAKLVEKGKSQFVGPEIKGKTLGVIGLGAIGAQAAEAAFYLGMNVIGYDPFMSIETFMTKMPFAKKVDDENEIFEKADYITLHLPLNPQTKEMINDETLAKCKDGVRIVNLARGGLVNDEALAQALESGKVACYVTDFPNDKTLEMKNAIAIPHLGASTPESEDNCAIMAASEIKDFLLNGNIKNSVNFPSVSSERSTGTRYCIIHKNIPTILNHCTAVLSNGDRNIDHLTSKFKGDYAYTIVDMTENTNGAIGKELEAIDGVIRVTVL